MITTNKNIMYGGIVNEYVLFSMSRSVQGNLAVPLGFV